MISVSGKNWEEIKINQNLVNKLKQDYGFDDILSRLIISRKFNEEEISSINNNLNLNNVFLNTDDFKRSVQLVLESINKKEKICILGDYDVDGSAATSLFVKFLDDIKHPSRIRYQKHVVFLAFARCQRVEHQLGAADPRNV